MMSNEKMKMISEDRNIAFAVDSLMQRETIHTAIVIFMVMYRK